MEANSMLPLTSACAADTFYVYLLSEQILQNPTISRCRYTCAFALLLEHIGVVKYTACVVGLTILDHPGN